MQLEAAASGTNDPGEARAELRTEGNLAVAPDWRNELSQRLAAHRARRRELCPDATQVDFPFEEAWPAEPARSETRAVAPIPFQAPSESGASGSPGAPPPPRHRPRVERMAIDISQPVLNFESRQNDPAGQHTQVLAIPVASLDDRRSAGLLDLAILTFAYVCFQAMFYALGGRWTLSKMDFGVTLATMAVFYAQYFSLFTLFGGATPGMRIRGLRVVTFDGSRPSWPQLICRSVGYLVSAGMLMLGFLWTLLDPERLSWHDRISETCITRAEPSAR